MQGPVWAILILGVLLVAVLYSSVGHGGASGYLALLVLAGFARPEITPVVLVLNILVASIGFVAYRRAGHFSSALLVPFVVASIPAAFVGGMLAVDDRAYRFILGCALAAAAIRFLLVPSIASPSRPIPTRRTWEIGLPVGAVLGLLAGMVGIGGGIFLSPLLLFMGWADAKQTAAVSAAFIVLNSLTGLSAQFLRGASLDWSLTLPLLAAVAVGGAIGSFLGATRFSLLALQRLLGIVLALAGLKLIAELW
ncbi:MAG: sulfite exporter TauE/SafE family protein [Nitrospirae bacterium]|nr:sulfite exporter TauE/SafE family protein [Nitrospirota bacterium]